MEKEKPTNAEIFVLIYTLLCLFLFIYYIIINKGKEFAFSECLDSYGGCSKVVSLYGKTFFQQLLNFELIHAFANALNNVVISLIGSLCGAIIPTIIIFSIVNIIQLIITFLNKIF
jgi:hypothetical protein